MSFSHFLKFKKNIQYFSIITIVLVGLDFFFGKERNPVQADSLMNSDLKKKSNLSSDFKSGPVTDSLAYEEEKIALNIDSSSQVDESIKEIKSDFQNPLQQMSDEQKFVLIKKQIKNNKDNELEVDQYLKNLSPQLKEDVIQLYSQIELESRNSRGFLAYLVARDLKSIADAQFLKSVFSEKPCLGLQSCSQVEASDPHHDSINQTTLDYPQLAVLYQIDKKLKQQPEILKDLKLKEEIVAIIREASHFPSPKVASMAEKINLKYKLY